MKRVCGFLLGLLLAVPLAAQTRTPARTVKLADHLYEITTFGLNSIGVKVVALVGPDGVLLVDGGTAEAAGEVRAALDALGAGPVRFIINTHFHDDHVGGNHALAKDTVVIAHDAVGRRLTTGLAMLAPPPTFTAPAVTFSHTLTVRFAGEEIRVRHHPKAHTDGDATVQFVHAGVVAVGDLIFADRFPFIDLASGGTVAGYLATLASLADEFPEGTRFVATHGAIYSAAQVASYRRELAAMDEKVRAALAAGRTPEQILSDKLLAAWPGWAGSFVTADRFAGTLIASARPASRAALPSVLDRLVPVLVKGSGDDAVRLFRTLKAERPPAYTFGEAEINRLGYALLGVGRHDDAIAILVLNVEEHPESGNVYDSLAEAYMAAGKRDLAIANYTKSLELDPSNTNATQMLEKLKSH